MAGPLTTRALALAAVAIVATAALAWIGAGVLARRTLAARVPAIAQLRGLPAPAAEAIREADAAVRQAPSAATIGALGVAYHAGQLPGPALTVFALAERLAPGDAAWPYHRALVLDERNDGATDAALERTVTLAPRHGLAWYRLAERRFKQGRIDDAAAAYTRAADVQAVDPFLPPGVGARRTDALFAYAEFGLARVALERGDAAAARQRLDAALASVPSFGPARALSRQLAGDEVATTARAPATPYVPPADPALDAVVASSRHSDLLLKHAGVAARGGDAAWREFLVRRALQFNPDDLNVLMEMAALLQATGRPAEALPYLTTHEQLAPGDHHALVEHGQVLADLGRLPEAEAVLRRAVVVRDAAAEYNLGTVLDRLGRWQEARARYERAIAINPFHARAMNNLGAGLDQRGDAAGLRWFERALAAAPDAAEVHVNYGSALLRLKRFADAATTLTAAIALAPRDANAHSNLGIALASLGDLPKAREAFAQALAIDPGHVNARGNLAQVTAALAQ